MTSRIRATRYHDFSCGHRVAGHENKCAFLHGHNYRVTFHCEVPEGSLDHLGRVIDFSVMKAKLCQWLEDNWDHKFLMWVEDPFTKILCHGETRSSMVLVHFNPTAENMALYLLNEIGPKQLEGSGVTLAKVVIEETRKCSAEAQNA